jgi:hypothetical protein
MTDTTQGAVDAPITDEERERIQRDVVRLLAAVVALIIAANIVFLATHHTSSGTDSGGALSSDPIDAIGPVPGVELAAYTQRRQVALGRVQTTRVAAASFSQYITETEARRLLQGFDVKALLVAAPGGGPEVAHGALEQWAAQARKDALDQKAQFESYLKDTKDPDFVKQYQAEVARLDKLSKTLAPGGPIVFGAVVVSDPSGLHRLATTTGVRLVDVAAASAVPSDSNIHGVRPEETAKAGTPVTRPG